LDDPRCHVGLQLSAGIRYRKTNKINKAAIRDRATIEIKRIQKAVGVGQLDTFDEFKSFFDTAMEIATGKFMKYKYSTLLLKT